MTCGDDADLLRLDVPTRSIKADDLAAFAVWMMSTPMESAPRA